MSNKSSDKKLIRFWAFIKRRPYFLPLFFIALFFVVMLVTNREKPYLLSDLPPDVLTTVRENFCIPEAKFKVLKTRFKAEILTDGVPAAATIERTEENVGNGIALRRDKWFQENSTWPVYESRQYIAGGFMSLNFDERYPMPLFGALLKEDGWARSKLVEIKVNKRSERMESIGSVCEYESRVDNRLNDDTGLREDILTKRRCVTVSRLNASTIHSNFLGDAYQVNCESEQMITTSGGIPPKKKEEKTKRVHVYYSIPAWSWLLSARRAEDSDSSEWSNLKGRFELTHFSIE